MILWLFKRISLKFKV